MKDFLDIILVSPGPYHETRPRGSVPYDPLSPGLLRSVGLRSAA